MVIAELFDDVDYDYIMMVVICIKTPVRNVRECMDQRSIEKNKPCAAC